MNALSPPDDKTVIHSELNCDEIESDCMNTQSAREDTIKKDLKRTLENEIRKQPNGVTHHQLQADETSNESKSGSLRATGNFFKAFIAARVKAKSCPPTPSGVTLINSETAPIRSSSGGFVET